MTMKTRKHRAAVHQRLGTDFEEGLDPRELSDFEEDWLDKLRFERSRSTRLDLCDYVQQLAG